MSREIFGVFVIASDSVSNDSKPNSAAAQALPRECQLCGCFGGALQPQHGGSGPASPQHSRKLSSMVWVRPWASRRIRRLQARKHHKQQRWVIRMAAACFHRGITNPLSPKRRFTNKGCQKLPLASDFSVAFRLRAYRLKCSVWPIAALLIRRLFRAGKRLKSRTRS
jgi:hypothetical protein